ncbi:hypothetical protein H6F86_00315 [Phormidium sp. FACHB-592]|uniref:High light inducible protein n=1 Tax=Stenomitos frigidus AS-A4 TaxID=2933935 RepID=A0ABV0KU75_9CYAN|nr:hypothetical protein [Phormidium sp. FACHB-592]MBD2072377.1 hypothetical protein [Phormidium sp. FACHB-592]
MEDFSPTDIALDSGYYHPTNEAGFWIVVAIALLCLVTWALRDHAP